ncbi:MAG: hypothetical protein QM564_09815 [Bergeyella sp.]
MARITLEYDSQNTIAKKALDFLLSIGTFKKVEAKNAIEISLEEARNGKVTKHKSVEDYFKKIAK